MASQITPPAVVDIGDTGIRRHLWTRTEARRALEQGLLPPDQRMELIAGELIEKIAQNRQHGISLAKAQRALAEAFGDAFYVSVQTPLEVDEANEPEPDLMVVSGAPDDYEDHPGATDVALVMEISDTTVRYDQTVKTDVYARAGVGEYWILVLKTRTLEVRRDPAELPGAPNGFGYRSLTVYRETDSVTPVRGAPAHIDVVSLLPARRTTDS